MDGLFYAAGWQDFWDTALEDPADEQEAEVELEFNPKDTNRQQAWGVIKSHMSSAERKKFTSIAKGHVEGLLRKLRHTYLKKNEIALDKLRRQLSEAQLEDHVDLAAYNNCSHWMGC